jgi:hypothetical protein
MWRAPVHGLWKVPDELPARLVRLWEWAIAQLRSGRLADENLTNAAHTGFDVSARTWARLGRNRLRRPSAASTVSTVVHNGGRRALSP